MAQHFPLQAGNTGARQYRAGMPSLDKTYSLHSSRLVLGGIVGVLCLAAVFFWGTIAAIQMIDQNAINGERERAMVAIGLQQRAGISIDSVIAGKIGRDYVFTDARLARAGALRSDETSVPVAGTSLVFAWTPRRLASETAVVVAPLRVTTVLLILGGVILILQRLYKLATELDARRKAARELATRDSLTGVVNRRGFSEALEQGFASGTDLALLYLDLDEFKQVNDRYGHATGDQLLHCVAQRLAHTVGPNDMVGRMGGDEFVVLRRGVTTRAELAELASRIHSRITLPYGLGDTEAEVGLSIGIAQRSPNMTAPGDLLGSADAALYRAKAIDATAYTFAEELVEGLPKAA